MKTYGCARCGREFTTLANFDRHQQGKYPHGYCVTDQVLTAQGLMAEGSIWGPPAAFRRRRRQRERMAEMQRQRQRQGRARAAT